MPIDQVLLSNTFNEFRITVNDIANTVNDLTANSLSGDIVANTITVGDIVSNTITVGEISSNLIPDANLTYDLGTATNRWKDLYLSGNTIFLGAAEISYDGSKVVFEAGGADLLDTSNLNASNLNFGTIPDARFPTTLPASNGVNLTFINATNIGTGTLNADRLATSGVSAGTYGSASQVPVLVVDNKGRITSASNTNVAGVTSFTYYSANTNLVIGTADGGTFSANIQASSANGASTIVARDAAGSFTANVVNATTFLGDGSQLTGVSAGLSIADDTSTDATRYIPFLDSTSGTATSANVSSTKLYFNPSTGTLNATNLNSLSDATLKENLSVIQNPLSLIKNLNGVEFNWSDTKQKSSGLVAQELEKVIPHLVSTDNGLKSVNYNGLIGYLVETIKELNSRIENLERK